MEREKILQSLNSIKARDPRFKAFGANVHHYAVNSPLDVDLIDKYEEYNKVKLPDDFIFFYTEISCGGAGPYYGLHVALKELTFIPTPLLARECLEIDIDFNQVDYDDTKSLVESNNQVKELVEKIGYEKAIIKLLEIAEYGSGYYIYLVLSGKDYGKVALGINYSESELDGKSVTYPNYTVLYDNFNSLYMDWLNKLLRHSFIN